MWDRWLSNGFILGWRNLLSLRPLRMFGFMIKIYRLKYTCKSLYIFQSGQRFHPNNYLLWLRRLVWTGVSTQLTFPHCVFAHAPSSSHGLWWFLFIPRFFACRRKPFVRCDFPYLVTRKKLRSHSSTSSVTITAWCTLYHFTVIGCLAESRKAVVV